MKVLTPGDRSGDDQALDRSIEGARLFVVSPSSVTARVQVSEFASELVPLPDDWSATIYRNWAFPADVLQAWQKLSDAAGDGGIFLAPSWFELWWHSVQLPNKLFVIVLAHAGVIRGVVPCCLSRAESTQKRLGSMAQDIFYDFLFAPGYHESGLRAFARLLSTKSLPGPMSFKLFTNTYCEALTHALRSEHLPFSTAGEAWAPYIDFAGRSWQEYYETLHPKLKNNIKKGKRRAAKEGTLSFEAVTDLASVDQLLTEAFQVEASGWKGDEGTAISCDFTREEWFRAFARWAASIHCLYIFVLRLDGRMIAFDFCFGNGSTIFALKTGYESRFASRLSAGNIMRHELLHYLFEHPQFKRYDFMGECYSWKSEWTSTSGRYYWFHVYPATLTGWTKFLLTDAWRSPLKRSAALVRFVRRVRHLLKGGRRKNGDD